LRCDNSQTPERSGATRVSTILGLDLGKFKSTACLDDPTTNAACITAVDTEPTDLRRLLEAERPDLVVFEICTIAGWVADTRAALRRPYAVANPMHEAWSWRKVQRKTDRDDALKLARMAALGELPTVPMPGRAAREYRALVQDRDRLVGRRTAAQNRIRALCQRHGVLLPLGHRAWTRAGLELIGTLARPLADCGPEELWRGELALELGELAALTATAREAGARLDALGDADERVSGCASSPASGRGSFARRTSRRRRGRLRGQPRDPQLRVGPARPSGIDMPSRRSAPTVRFRKRSVKAHRTGRGVRRAARRLASLRGCRARRGRWCGNSPGRRRASRSGRG
jgi:hypothetical protein